MSKEIKISIPPGTPASRCRSCKRPIYWVTTATGKQMPVDPDGTSHFATCEYAKRWRKLKNARKVGAGRRSLRQGDLFGGGQG